MKKEVITMIFFKLKRFIQTPFHDIFIAVIYLELKIRKFQLCVICHIDIIHAKLTILELREKYTGGE